MLKPYLSALAISLPYLFSPSALAQKSLGDLYENKEFGFKVKSIAKWEQIPTQPGEQYVVAQFSGDAIDLTVTKDGGMTQVTPDFYILRFETEVAGPLTTGDGEKKTGEDKAPPSKEDKKKNKDALEEAQKFRNFQQWLKKVNIPGIRKIGEIKNTKYGKLPVSEQEFLAAYNVGWGVDRHFFVAEFALEGQNIALVYNTPDKQYDKWESVFQKSARSFGLIEKSKTEVLTSSGKGDANDLASQRQKHEIDVAKVPGWSLEETKNYFIKIHNSDRDFIAMVKEHVEIIRERLEADFPPLKPITVKSVLRVCRDREEYTNYGGPGGSAGYWNYVTEELVIYDAKEYQRSDSFRTMYHEAFHQYIFYRCGEISPHSWYNEGTGDYYAGANYKYGKLEIKPFLWRTDTIREAIQQKKHVPLEKIIRYSKQDYYANPQICYSQGWSIVYFLREGKKQRAKGWKKEWEGILETYLQVITETKDPGKAVNAAFEGIDLKELESSWMEFVKSL